MPASARSSGVVAGLASYFLWGFLPLYFFVLGSNGPWEIVSWRVVWSLVFCVGILVVTGQIRATIALLRNRRLVALTFTAGALVFINWLLYIITSTTGRILEGSLGYFINPLLTIILGVFVLGEKLRPAQWAAMGFAGAATVVIAVGYGEIPWFSFGLALSFGLYGLVKNRVGVQLTATQSLTFETLGLVPVAAILLGVVATSSGLLFWDGNIGQTFLFVLLGPVTAIPLLLFGYAAGRVPLSWMGFMQFLAPTLQFVVGAFIMHEPMPTARWVGFILVWVGLIVLTVDIGPRRHELHKS